MKICRKCGVEKAIDEFHTHTKAADGHINSCKVCIDKEALERYHNKKDTPEFKSKNEERKQYKKEWYQSNKESLKIKSKEYRVKNAEQIKIDKKKYNQENKEKIRISRKKFYAKNPKAREKLNLNKVKYKKSDKCKLNANQYAKEKRRKDPLQQFKECLRSRISSALKGRLWKKTNRTQEILGCDYLTVKSYLENQFKPGMTWKNMGKGGWHIDHKIPLATAKTKEVMEKLCHYTNLQPLWAEDNLSKGAKIMCNPCTYQWTRSKTWENIPDGPMCFPTTYQIQTSTK